MYQHSKYGPGFLAHPVYEYKTKDKGRRPREVRVRGGGRGCDDLILKWHILMHISGILTYLF